MKLIYNVNYLASWERFVAGELPDALAEAMECLNRPGSPAGSVENPGEGSLEDSDGVDGDVGGSASDDPDRRAGDDDFDGGYSRPAPMETRTEADGTIVSTTDTGYTSVRYPDGRSEIYRPDGSHLYDLDADGSETPGTFGVRGDYGSGAYGIGGSAPMADVGVQSPSGDYPMGDAPPLGDASRPDSAGIRPEPGESRTGPDGSVVSTTEEGYTSVRRPDGTSEIYRPDGSHLYDLDGDGSAIEGSKGARGNFSAGLPEEGDDPDDIGHSVAGFNDTVKARLESLPEEPVARAEALEQLAADVRAQAERYTPEVVGDTRFHNDDGAEIDLPEHFRSYAQQLTDAAENSRHQAQGIDLLGEAVTEANAALDYVPRPTDPEEIPSDDPLAGFREAEGNLDYTAEQYRRQAERIAESPHHDLLVGLEDGSSITAVDYFRDQADALDDQSADIARQRERADLSLIASAAQQQADTFDEYEARVEAFEQNERRMDTTGLGADFESDVFAPQYRPPTDAEIDAAGAIDDESAISRGDLLAGALAERDRHLADAAAIPDESAVTRADEQADDIRAAEERRTARDRWIEMLVRGASGQTGYSNLEEAETYIAEFQSARDNVERVYREAYGDDWKRHLDADSAERFLEDTKVGTVNIGPVVDAARAIGTGRHISNYDSDIPVNIDGGFLPVVGTLADASVRGRDGYSGGDLAFIAGGAALDVVPVPGPAAIGRGTRAGLVVARNPVPAWEIVTGSRRTQQSVLQGTMDAPYQLTGTRNRPKGVSNIPVEFGKEVIIDDQSVPGYEGLLYQRDRAFQLYRETGVPQPIELPTAGGGTQTVYVGGSRAGMETGRGAATHTSATAGTIAEASTDPSGVISLFKHDDHGNLLPDVEQRFFLTTTGAESLVSGAAFGSQRTAIDNPGFIDLVNPENIGQIQPVRKVFGGDVDSGVINPSAVVELEAGIPAGQRIAGGEGVPIYRERPVGLQQLQGQDVYRYIDLPPAEQPGRLTVLRSNVLAAIDNARGHTDNFYVVQRDADGVQQVFRQSDLDELERQGVDLGDALRVEGRFGENRLISRREWVQSAQSIGRGLGHGNRSTGQDLGRGTENIGGSRGISDSRIDSRGNIDGRALWNGNVDGRGLTQPTPPVSTPEARLRHQSGPDPRLPDPTMPTPKPRLPDPTTPEPQIPDPTVRIPDPGDPPVPTPEPVIPEARVVEPGQPDTGRPEPGRPAIGVGTPEGVPQVRTPPPVIRRRKQTEDPPARIVRRATEDEEGPLYPHEVEWVEHSLHRADLETGEVTSQPLSDTNLRTFRVTRRGREQLRQREIEGSNLDIGNQGDQVSAEEVSERTRPATFRRREGATGGEAMPEFGRLPTGPRGGQRRGRGGRRGRRGQDDDLLQNNAPSEITLVLGEEQ